MSAKAWWSPDELGRHDHFVRSIAVSANGQWLATGDEQSHARLWSLGNTTTIALDGHRDAVSSVAFATSDLLLTGSWDRTVRAWSIPSGEMVATLRGHVDRVEAVGWATSVRRVVSANEFGRVLEHTPDAVAPVANWDAHASRVRCLLVAGDGSWVSAGDDGRIVQRTASGRLHQLCWLGSACYGLAEALGGGWWAVLAEGRLVRVLADGRVAPCAEDGSYLRAIATSPDGSRVAFGGKSGVLHLWSDDGPTVVTRAERTILHVVWLDSRRLIMSGRDGLLVLAEEGVEGWSCHVLKGHSDHVFALVPVPGGFCTGSFDHRVLRWLRRGDTVTGDSIECPPCADGDETRQSGSRQ